MGILSTITTGVYKYVAIAGIGLALAVGGFFYGRHVGEQQSKITISNYEDAKASQTIQLDGYLAPEALDIATKYTAEVVHGKDVGATNDQTITKTVTDKQPLSRGWVYSYNTSLTGNPIDATISADGTSSGLSATAALTGIADNNTTCLNYEKQVIGLQSYINGYNAAVTKVNSRKK